jgi:NADPH-dependent 7-cyano-7-deazaguanine reductase QueF
MKSIQPVLLLRIIGLELFLTAFKSCLQSGSSDWFLHIRIKQSGRIISLSSMILKLILRHRRQCHQLCVRQVKGPR